MKKLNLCVIALFMLSFCSVTGQETIIEDIRLDSVVWNKINDYLVELNKGPIKHFEDGMMREFSRRLTRINSGREYISHSDSVGWVCSYECIHRLTINSSGMDNSLIAKTETKQYDELAEGIVNTWISSPPHRRGISMDDYAATTVTTVIKYDKAKGTASLTTLWHAIEKVEVSTTESGYCYEPPKPIK